MIAKAQEQTTKIENLLSKYFVMGILNLTDDSFSGDGITDKELLQKRIIELVGSRVHCIDIGAESTRPGARLVNEEEEKRKVLEAIAMIRSISPTTLISVDTWKSEVAKASLEAGADSINDISGGQFDSKMFDVIAKYPHSYYMLGHVKGTFETMHEKYLYDDLVEELVVYFKERITKLEEHGFPASHIILDPCIGFSKRAEENLLILKNLKQLQERTKMPLIIGLSRKRFIKKLSGDEDNDSLDSYTLTLNMLALHDGATVIRTHETVRTMKMIRIMEAITTIPS